MQKGAAAHGQRPRPLSQSLSALPAPPKWEPLAVHANSISLPRPLPLRKDFPRTGGRCRAATKGGVWHGVSRDGEGEPAKEKASATTIRRLSEIQKRLLQMLLLYTILRHAKGTSARNIILRPSGHPDARAVCVPERRTVAAMQSTGCRQKHRQKRHRPSIHWKTR